MKEIIARLRGAPPPDLFATASESDAAVLRGLAQAGADLTKPRRTVHRLHFPDEERALRAATLVESRERQVTTRPAAEGAGGAAVGAVTAGGSWLVQVEQVIVTSPRAIDALRREFEQVALGLGGTFDGWEAAASP